MPGLVIDLCTPPPSPQRASSGGGGCIDLCTPPSSPTPHDAPAAAAPSAAAPAAAAPAAAAPAAAAPAGSKRPLSTAALSTAPVKLQRPEAGPSSSADAAPSLVEDEEEVLETAAPPAPNKDVRMGGDADENEDVQCTGRTGDNALMDFPHARENCVAVKFVQGQVPTSWARASVRVSRSLHFSLFHPHPASPAGVQVLRELLLLRLRCAGQGVSRVGRQPLQSIAPLCRVAAAAQAVEVAAGRRRRR